MRYLCSTQGTRHRRHYVKDDCHHALCGFAPTMGARWKPAPRGTRNCVNCHRIAGGLPAVIHHAYPSLSA